MSGTVRCGGDEALAFLLDCSSRSLRDESDVEEGKEVIMDDMRTRTIRSVSRFTQNGVILKRVMLRNMVYKIDNSANTRMKNREIRLRQQKLLLTGDLYNDAEEGEEEEDYASFLSGSSNLKEKETTTGKEILLYCGPSNVRLEDVLGDEVQCARATATRRTKTAAIVYTRTG